MVKKKSALVDRRKSLARERVPLPEKRQHVPQGTKAH